MKISKLEKGSEFIPIISNWLWCEWGNSSNVKYWRSWVERSTCETDVPQTYIGKIGNNIVGTVSLWRCDLQSCQDIFPWLGGLYIDKAYRGQGYAKQLVDFAANVAYELGYHEIYLFTELHGFFEKLGWVYLESVPNEHDVMVNLLKKELNLRG